MTNIFKKGIRRQIILPMIITMICTMTLIYTFLIYENEKNIINSSIIFAKSNIEQYLTLRSYYTSNVIHKLMNYSNVKVNVALDDSKNSIPLPATMIHDLSNLLKNKQSKIQLNLYSNFPFPNRKERVLDNFEKESLIFFKKNPKDLFYRREVFNKKDSVRVAIADTMTNKTCVSCHNSLPNTPKNDWKLNDVRGALEIIIPIENIVKNNVSSTKQTIYILFAILILLILIIYITIKSKMIDSIEKITLFVNDIKNGDLSNKLVINQHNELKILAQDINTMKDSLKDTLNLLHNENISRRETEKKLEQLNNELEDKIKARTVELNIQNEELHKAVNKLESTQDNLAKSQKMAQLGELVGGITHEINTPLGISITTSSYIESISDDLKKAYNNDNMSEEDFKNYLTKVEENIKIILTSLDRVTVMLNSFRDIALDQVIEEKRFFNLQDYINETIISLKHKTKKYNHEIIVDIDKSILIESYPGYFYQIITNLINNSYLHAFEGINHGRITINATKSDKEIKLVYSDNGRGVKKENKASLFKEYYTTKRGKGGTGLGLGIINNIIRNKLNGNIEIETEENKGLKLTISIPIK